MKAILPIVVAGALCVGACTNKEVADASNTGLTLIVGSYSEPGDSALYVYNFDADSATTNLLYRLPVANASFAAIGGDGVVYAVCESDEANSTINIIAPDSVDRRLRVVDTKAVGSSSPCYVTMSPDGRYVLTADYGGGTVSLFPIADSRFAGDVRHVAFEGHGVDSVRQAASHSHCVAFTPDKRYLLVDDLGLDRIHMFSLVGDSLIADRPDKDIVIKPGSGPRHITFNAAGTMAYLVNELSDEVTVLSYDGSILMPVQYIAADTVGARGAADIHLSPDGRHLYASLRLKNDGIATFDVDSVSGLLTYRSHTPTSVHPRNFTFSPDGRYMLVACRDGNVVEIYEVGADGSLTDTGRRITQTKPVFVTFYPSSSAN